jgi:hypothetical protein
MVSTETPSFSATLPMGRVGVVSCFFIPVFINTSIVPEEIDEF